MSFNEWNTFKLEDLCTDITDGSHASPKTVNEGYPMASVKDMEYNYINIETCRKISEEDYEKLVKGKCKPLINDVLIAKDGSYMKYVNVVKEEKDLVLLSSIAILRPILSKLYPDFLKYYLLNPIIKKDLERGYVSGSAIRRIVLKDFKRFPVTVPPIKEQKAIAKILSDLDDKIEVNNNINKNLEEMAQAIFKHWFVDFEFPNEEGKPYKSSGGEMVDSELGMIPKGWELKEIGKLPVTVTDYVANGSFKSLKDNVTIYEENNYALFIRNTDLKCKFISSKRFVDEHAYNFLSKSRLFGGEVIISNVGDVGSVYICPKFDIPMTLGNNVIMINTDKNEIDLNHYIFRLFKSDLGQYLIDGITGGSAQPKFNKTDFRNIKLSMPSNEVLIKYNKVIESIENKILHNDKQNEKLSNLRDTLLPKLMSGEIRVPID